MNYTEFKSKIENGETFSAYLIEGEDAFFRERAYSLLKSKFLNEPMLNLATFNGDEMDKSQFYASLYQYPFMSDKRLTVAFEFYPKQEEIKGQLSEFLNNPPDGDILIIINEKPSDVLKKQKLCFVDCKKADSAIIVRWIKAKCNSSGIDIQLETANKLTEYALNDMSTVANETEKLINYCYDKKKIELSDLEEIVHKSNEFKIYEMTDAIAKKNFSLAITIIEDMLNRGENSIRVLNSVYNYFRKLLLFAISNQTNKELEEIFAMKEYAVIKTKSQAKLFKKVALKKAIDALTQADYKIKSGFIEQDKQMWLTIFKIMTEK